MRISSTGTHTSQRGYQAYYLAAALPSTISNGRNGVNPRSGSVPSRFSPSQVSAANIGRRARETPRASCGGGESSAPRCTVPLVPRVEAMRLPTREGKRGEQGSCRDRCPQPVGSASAPQPAIRGAERREAIVGTGRHLGCGFSAGGCGGESESGGDGCNPNRVLQCGFRRHSGPVVPRSSGRTTLDDRGPGLPVREFGIAAADRSGHSEYHKGRDLDRVAPPAVLMGLGQGSPRISPIGENTFQKIFERFLLHIHVTFSKGFLVTVL